MKKIIFLLLCLIIPFVSVSALEFPETYASKVLVYNLTDDEVLYDKDGDKVTSIASLTKIMTVYVAVTEGMLDESVTITHEMLANVHWDLHLTGIRVGETYTLREICYAAMIDSGGDDTNVIAYAVAGSIENFVKLMNQKAEEIGMNDTHYANVHGLDQYGHHSTARDIKKLVVEALKNDDFKDIYYKQEYVMNDHLTVKRWYNPMISESGLDPANLLGGKTGFTDGAGVCFTGFYKSDDHEFLIIVLNADGSIKQAHHIMDLISMMKFVDDNYNYYTVVHKGDLIGSIPTFLAKDNSYYVYAPEDIVLYLPSDYDINDLSIEPTLTSSIMYNALKGKLLGNVEYSYKGEIVGRSDIYLDKNMELNVAMYIDYYTNDFVLIVSLVILVGLLFALRYTRVIKNNK